MCYGEKIPVSEAVNECGQNSAEYDRIPNFGGKVCFLQHNGDFEEL